MTNTKIIKEIKELYKKGEIFKIESFIEESLLEVGYDTELMIRLALLQLTIPIKDYYKSIECLEKILEHESHNLYALLVLSDIHHNYLGGIENELFDKLCKVETNDSEEKSFIELAKAWYYKDNNNTEKYRECLQKSVDTFKYNVWNLVYLGREYLESQRETGEVLINKAINNVKLIYSENNNIEDCTDIGEYLNEMFRGSHLTKQVFDWIKSYCSKEPN